MLDCIEYNPLKTKANRALSVERARKLTMGKINTEPAYAQRKYRPRRLALAACAALMAVVVSGTAFAANTFGLHDLIDQVFGWTVNEAAAVLELDLDADYPTAGGGSFGDNHYAYTMKSVTLSATGLTFSYAYTFDGALTASPLPMSLRLGLKDGAKIDATVTDYTDENGVITATATFPESVNLAEASYMQFGTPDFGQAASGDGIIGGILIPVTTPNVLEEDKTLEDWGGKLDILPPAQ
jgi:hypothetical protein